MSIVPSELKFYKSSVVTDTSTNGGVMSNNLITSGVSQNVFPNVFSAERLSGSTKYRKVFIKVANDDDLTLVDSKVWLDDVTQADDWAVFFAGTQTNTQADITGSERIYGCATLKNSVTAGVGTTLVVTVEDASLTGMFVDGDTIRITNKATPDAVTGTDELLTISGTPSVSGTDVTITITSSTLNSYTAGASSRVMPLYMKGDVECAVSGFTVTSAAGTYDDTTYQIAMDNIGTIQQTWTLTFTDASNFTVTGSTVTGLASGTTSANYAPTNTTFTKPYFTLYKDGFGGTFANGDTITFTTSPAAIPIWEKRVVPAGAGSISANKITLAVTGESA